MYKKQTQFEPQVDPTQSQQKLDITYIVLKDILMVNSSAIEGDENRYANSIETLLSDLPVENIKNIEAHKEEYITKIEKPIFKTFCGRQMGSIENPLMANVKGRDWNWSADRNNGKPIVISPTIEEVEEIDYHKLLRFIMSELQSIGVTWKTEPHDRVGKRIKQPPTPLITLKDNSQARLLIQKEVPPEIALLQNEVNSTEDREEIEDSEEMDLEDDEQ